MLHILTTTRVASGNLARYNDVLHDKEYQALMQDRKLPRGFKWYHIGLDNSNESLFLTKLPVVKNIWMIDIKAADALSICWLETEES